MSFTLSNCLQGKEVLVVGGGIAGLTTALEAAEAGCRVVLIEKTPWLGGRVLQMNQYFPKLCPPLCGLEIQFQRLRINRRITVLTQAVLEQLTGSPGNYEATVRIAPRFVAATCTLCGQCTKVCPAERPDDLNLGQTKTRAAYLPHALAYPPAYVIDREACKEGCRECEKACTCGAINLNQQGERWKMNVSAVIVATGWAPYDAAKITNLGFGLYPNMVTNVMMERLAAPSGPTAGRLVRPSDGAPPASVAFVQCAGSRDENHLAYCSGVCCAASLKQATYVRDLAPGADISIFYIDIRTLGLLEDFYAKVAADPKVHLIKGKVAKVEEDAGTHDLLLTAEDVLNGRKMTARASLVVLATGIVPQTAGLPAEFQLDEFGFANMPARRAGLYAAGCVRRPGEVSASVRDATGAALKALQCVVRGARHE